MSKLLPLTQQLQSLRNARASVRQQSAWATVGTAILVALLVLFAVDWFFQREVGPIQRIVLMLVGIGGIVWAFKMYAWPLLRVREESTDMALLVERKQALDSDLVAALQFEKDREGKWGSKVLEDAVVDYIARVSPELNVFEGFSRGDLPRRAMILGAIAILTLAVAAIFPHHVWTFIQRLALGNPHYPSTITIDALVLNEHAVVRNAATGESPQPIVCVEAQPVRFLAVCRGTEAPEAKMKLDAVDFRGSSEVALKRITDDDRLRLLQESKNELRTVDEGRTSRTKLAARLWCDAPRAADALLEAADNDVVIAMTEIDRAIREWPQSKREGNIYVGELPRLTNDIRYQLDLDGAWTEPGLVRMAHLPQVEPVLTITPPSYVGTKNREQVGGRQTAVLEGSKVEFALESKNQRRLAKAWVVLTSGQTSQKVDLIAADKGMLKWELPLESSPLASVRGDWRFEGFAEDVDGLMPESPIRGSIRIRPDGQAILSLASIHKVVLPTASPVLEYKATDDFGLKRLRLVAQVLPAEAASSTESPDSSTADETPAKSSSADDEAPPALDVDLLEGGEPMLAKRLPATGKHSLSMASIKAPGKTTPLGKGDRVRIVLEAEDWRGDAAGKIVRSEPITLEISDEAGVLAAISEADQRSEERLTDIIKRQLGIGENP